MIININEDGSTSVQAVGYMASYDKEGKLKMSIGCEAPKNIYIHNVFKQKVDKTKFYDVGMTLSVDKGTTVDNFKVFDAAIKSALITSAVIDSSKINKIPNDDHIRQIVREELRQFVARESERGGLFSKW